jgi:Mrp family chromosome partitioning ATPase
MSIIESAFLKNQKEKGEDATEEKGLKQHANKPITEPVTSSQVSGGSTVKQNIARMKQSKLYSKEELSERGLISKEASDRKLMNEYRNLRTNLLASSHSKNFVTLITSIDPSFDTSKMTANLAATFALDEGKTSVVINADVNSDKSNELFNVEPSFGLVDFIESDEMPIDQVIYETPINRLRYIPIGLNAESSAEHFSGQRMKKTMASIVARYPERYIFVNAPSIASSADTRILLDISHKVILAVPYGLSTEEDIRQAVLSIGPEKLSGIVLEEF